MNCYNLKSKYVKWNSAIKNTYRRCDKHDVTDLYRMCGDPVRENEAFQMHCNFSQMLLKDHFQASQMTEHNLIHWTEGNFPMLVGNPPSTSDGLL